MKVDLARREAGEEAPVYTRFASTNAEMPRGSPRAAGIEFPTCASGVREPPALNCEL